MNEGADDEEEPVYGRADHWDIQADRGWREDGGYAEGSLDGKALKGVILKHGWTLLLRHHPPEIQVMNG